MDVVAAALAPATAARQEEEPGDTAAQAKIDVLMAQCAALCQPPANAFTQLINTPTLVVWVQDTSTAAGTVVRICCPSSIHPFIVD